MKKVIIKCLVICFFSMCLGGAANQQSPLNEPFFIRHPYPNTGVSTNLIALHISPLQPDGNTGTAVCSGFRYHKRWLVTAAHCLWRFGTETNPRVKTNVKQLSNGVWQLSITNADNNLPNNATIYFYRNGYAEGSLYSHAEDIAIIGLDEEDKMISLMKENIKQLDIAHFQMQKIIDTAGENNSHVLSQMKKVYSTQKATRKKMLKIINDKKLFLQQPLDDYHFMTFSPESARIELNGKKSYGYWFEPIVENQSVIGRKRPVKYPFTFQGITSNDDHTVHWKGQEPGGMSGTPLIINGFVVGFGSGEQSTGLLTDDFTNFLKRYMGNDYVKGICARSLANEEAISRRTQP